MDQVLADLTGRGATGVASRVRKSYSALTDLCLARVLRKAVLPPMLLVLSRHEVVPTDTLPVLPSTLLQGSVILPNMAGLSFTA
jgi:hypothetical protein